MDYLQNVLMSWAGFGVTWFMIAILAFALVYVFFAVTAGTTNEEIIAVRNRILSKRQDFVKMWLVVLLVLGVFAAVLPGNTPKTNLRTDLSLVEQQNQLESLRRQSAEPMRTVPAPGDIIDSTDSSIERDHSRDLRQACREARQGFREMDMTQCEGVN